MTVTCGLPSGLMVLRWAIGPDAIKSRSSGGRLLMTGSPRRRTDEGMADFGDLPVVDAVQAQAAEVRTGRRMRGPGRGDRVVTGDQRIDVERRHTTRDLDGVFVVVAGALRSVTGRRVAVVDIVR